MLFWVDRENRSCRSKDRCRKDSDGPNILTSKNLLTKMPT